MGFVSRNMRSVNPVLSPHLPLVFHHIGSVPCMGAAYERVQHRLEVAGIASCALRGPSPFFFLLVNQKIDELLHVFLPLFRKSAVSLLQNRISHIRLHEPLFSTTTKLSDM